MHSYNAFIARLFCKTNSNIINKYIIYVTFIARLFDKVNSNIKNISNLLRLSPDYVTLCERKRAR